MTCCEQCKPKESVERTTIETELSMVWKTANVASLIGSNVQVISAIPNNDGIPLPAEQWRVDSTTNGEECSILVYRIHKSKFPELVAILQFNTATGNVSGRQFEPNPGFASIRVVMEKDLKVDLHYTKLAVDTYRAINPNGLVQLSSALQLRGSEKTRVQGVIDNLPGSSYPVLVVYDGPSNVIVKTIDAPAFNNNELW